MSRFDEKRHHSFDFFGSTVSIDGHHGNKETSMLKLLVLKDSLDMNDYSKVTKFSEDWLNGF